MTNTETIQSKLTIEELVTILEQEIPFCFLETSLGITYVLFNSKNYLSFHGDKNTTIMEYIRRDHTKKYEKRSQAGWDQCTVIKEFNDHRKTYRSSWLKEDFNIDYTSDEQIPQLITRLEKLFSYFEDYVNNYNNSIFENVQR